MSKHKMNKHLITLSPMGSYYFGGERSFKFGEKDEKDKSALSSYIVESNLFPQQTSLLGMLRFWILKNSEEAFNTQINKILNKDEAVTLIGASSFCADKDNKFGKIENIGFCFLQNKEKDIILPTPFDYGLEVNFTDSTTAYYNGKVKTLPVIKYIDKKDKDGKKIEFYTPKEGLEKKYIGSDGQKLRKEVVFNGVKTIKEVDFFAEDEIFIKDQRIGINRNIETGITEENALYKQVFYRLADGFRFAFVAKFEDGYSLPTNGQIVELGGDSSKFILNYESWDDKPEVCYKENKMIKEPSGGYTKITLLSDTLLDNSVVEDTSVFSIAEHIPFQFLSFDTDDKTLYSRTDKTDKTDKSKRFSLFKRGSVFYFKDEKQVETFEKEVNEKEINKFEKEINKKQNFSNIGYNNYQPKTTNNHDSNK